MTTAGHDSRAVANKILEIGRAKGIEMSMMKLIKLVYFSHGWVLGLTGKPLCADYAEAWQYGPVFRGLYNALPYQGSQTVERLITDYFGKKVESMVAFTPDEEAIMERVIELYGDKGAFTLSDITHAPDSPWDRAIKIGLYAPISNQDIQEYFAAQVQH